MISKEARFLGKLGLGVDYRLFSQEEEGPNMRENGKTGFVSVVTPFYNTADFLAECIESVLAQTHTNFEYILVDNCSMDGSAEIAQSYASKDERIQLHRSQDFLDQVGNYNRAVRAISNASEFTKIVQADDWIFPRCLERMVEAGRKNEKIGIVSSYYLAGTEVMNVGLPFPSENVNGRRLARDHLRESHFLFGTPTSIMFRSEIVRASDDFYAKNRSHEDTEKCYEILEDWNFGFVHEVLSFSRVDEPSLLSGVRRYDPWRLERHIMVQKYGPRFLDGVELEELTRETESAYYAFLAEELPKRKGSEFWHYHRGGLASIGQRLDSGRLSRRVLRNALVFALCPSRWISMTLDLWRRR
jgi:glycosyltransferase involved in cell wall biosynthesis